MEKVEFSPDWAAVVAGTIRQKVDKFEKICLTYGFFRYYSIRRLQIVTESLHNRSGKAGARRGKTAESA
jgi:hypothetical protein